MEAVAPTVARLVADATGFVEGVARANGATRDWQDQLARADLASRKTGASAEAAAQRASVAMKRAAEAAAGMAKAQDQAAAASERLAAGTATQDEASAAATKAADAETAALEAQARAALAAERASIANAQAQLTMARQAGLAGAANEASAAKSSGAFAKVGKASALISLGVVAESIKMAGTFEQQTNVLVTAAGESQQNLQKVRDGILAIAGSTGTSWQKVTEALYQAEKAGYRGADALNVVKAAAQGAREEGANLATVTAATTSVMASYHLKASDSVMVTNEIKTAAGEAKTTMELFAGSLSTVLPLASANKIAFADVAGALASLTQHGTSADEAAQELAFTMRGLSAPNNVAINEMNQLGLSSVDVAQKLGDGPGGRGLTGTLNYLSETVLKKMGPAGTLLLSTFNASKLASKDAATELAALPPAAQKLAKAYADGSLTLKDYRLELKGLPTDQASLAQQFTTTENKAKGFQTAIRNGGSAAQTYSDAIKKLTGGAAGLNTVLQLTGESTAGTDERIKRIAESAKNAGADVAGWASTQKLANVQFDMFKQQAAALGIHLGQDLLPPLKAILGVLTQHPAILKAVAYGILAMGAAWTALKIESMISGVARLAARLLGLGTASATAAAELELLGGARGIGGVAGAAGTAEGAVGRFGGSFARSGLLAGGVVGVGLLGIAGAIHEIVNDSVKGLPYVDKLASAIGKGGLSGAPARAVISDALNKVGAGDDRKESINAYLQRVTSAPQAASFAHVAGLDSSVKDVGANMKSFYAVLQTGSRQAFTQFLANFNLLQTALKASPDTIGTVDRYLTALFDRYNSGRAAVAQVTGEERKYLQALYDNRTAAAATSTSSATLARTYNISAQAAQSLAAENRSYAYGLSVVGGQLNRLNPTLQGNTSSAQSNREAIHTAAFEVQAHAREVLVQTGNMKAANAVFQAGIGTIESNAAAVGANKGEVDKYIRSLGLVPPDKVTNVQIPGLDSASAAVANYLAMLNNIPSVVRTQTINYISDQAAGRITSLPFAGLNAAGGLLQGPGTGTSDSMVARVSNGEYITNAAATAKNLPVLEAINRGAVVKAVPGFAAGGQVSLSVAEEMKLMGFRTVRQAQQALGVGVDGIIGPITASALNAVVMGQDRSAIPADLRALWQRDGLLGGGGGGAAVAPAAASYLKALSAQASNAAFAGSAPFLSQLTGFNHAALTENTRAAFMNTMFAQGKMTAANVPGVEAEARNARALAAKTTAYFNAHKSGLQSAIAHGTPAQRKAAQLVYGELASDAWHTTEDARQETALAAQMRRQYGGPEATTRVPGAPTRDWSYLSAMSGHGGSAAQPIHITVVSQLDGKEVGKSVSKQILTTARRNIDNGLTPRRP